MRDEKTAAALLTLIRHPTLSIKEIAADLGWSYDALYHRVRGWVTPEVEEVRQIVAAARGRDNTAAMELAAKLYDLPGNGWFLASLPRAQPTARDLLAEAAKATEAAADLQHEIRTSAADGLVDSAEEARIANKAITAQRQVAEAQATARVVANLGPQCTLIEVRP